MMIRNRLVYKVLEILRLYPKRLDDRKLDWVKDLGGVVAYLRESGGRNLNLEFQLARKCSGYYGYLWWINEFHNREYAMVLPMHVNSLEFSEKILKDFKEKIQNS